MSRLTLAATAWIGLWISQPAIAQPRLVKDVYGIGIAGNCCTHGAGICGMFKGGRTRGW